MPVSKYFKLCDRQPTQWLAQVLASDRSTCAMRPIHFAIIGAVLRRRGAISAPTV